MGWNYYTAGYREHIGKSTYPGRGVFLWAIEPESIRGCGEHIAFPIVDEDDEGMTEEAFWEFVRGKEWDKESIGREFS